MCCAGSLARCVAIRGDRAAMSLGLSTPRQRTLQDAELKEHLQRLRLTDNVTSWYYLIRSYLYFVAVIGAAVWFGLYRQAQGWSVPWSVPVFALAIFLVGAGQHQLSGL